MLTCDEYITAFSLTHAFDVLDAEKGRVRIIAGGTELLPWARQGRAGDVHIPVLLDITAIPELSQYEVWNGRVLLGAATPIQRFLDTPTLIQEAPCMRFCAAWFADDQIRESATVGGNVMNASPAADGIPPLLAMDAEVELAARRDGMIVRRTMKLSDFVVGPGRVVADPGEILINLKFDALPGYGGAFEKVGHRRSLVIAVACVAALIQFEQDGRTVRDVRLAVGGVGPVPLRLYEVENFLRGATLDSATIQAAAERPTALVQSRSRQVYRRSVLRGFVARALLCAAKNAGGDLGSIAADVEAQYA